MGSTLNLDRYKKVVAQHLPRPIASDEDYAHWADILEAIDRSPGSTPEQRALSELMQIAMLEYRRSRNPEVYAANPLGTLKTLMETNNISQVELSRLLGVSRAAASQIVNGKRGISKATALKLAKRFALPVSAFLA